MDGEVGYRGKLGLLVPSTNTVVEHDVHLVRVRGVTFHAARMYIERPSMASDAALEDFLQQIRDSLRVAVRDVMTCGPDHLLMCMTAESFWGGAAGNEQLEAAIRAQAGVAVTTGARACREALASFGARRIGLVNPYQPAAEAQVVRYFAEVGCEVVRKISLLAASSLSVARVGEAELIAALRAVDGPDVEAIVQVGANLSMLRLAGAAERWLGKPVLAINAAMLWHALRERGLPDQFEEFGSLLREH